MNESRSITGLGPVQEVFCELLDIVEKITISGNTLTSKQFLSYNPSTDTTTYQDIDPVPDLDINSLTSLTSPNLTNDGLILSCNLWLPLYEWIWAPASYLLSQWLAKKGIMAAQCG
jgi:hypothetical protein